MISFLFLVGTFFAGVFLALLFSRPRAKSYEKPSSVFRSPPTTLSYFTREEVALHNKPEDLWVIIRPKNTQESRVYDLTSYVDEHPGGDGILNNAGGDSTEGFYGPQHPPRAMDILDDFCIGLLKE